MKNPLAGRAWIRNTKRETTRSGYYDENAKETRYGDTFVLRAKNRSEHIKIPAVGHVKDGWMELHIVAEGGEQIDVEYLEVSTYRRQPKVRVIQRYTPTYRWRPWHRYTYLYFYDGPVYYATDYDYYLRWSYPVYDHHYLSIRSYYGGYLGRYRGSYPSAYYRYYSPYYGSYHSSYRGTPKVYQRRTQLNRWSAQHETTRRQYSRSRLSANNRGENRTAVRRSVRTTLENHRSQTPATTERVARQSIIAQKLRTRASRCLNTPPKQRPKKHLRFGEYSEWAQSAAALFYCYNAGRESLQKIYRNTADYTALQTFYVFVETGRSRQVQAVTRARSIEPRHQIRVRHVRDQP